MEQFQGTFKRYEKKYLLSRKQYEMLIDRLEDKLTVDNFGKVIICNIYFDTPDHRLIRNSLEKPVYKEKLRLRSYGIPTDNEGVFVELKKKYKGVVYKRREKMKLKQAKQYLYDDFPLNETTQITKEIDWFISFYKELLPAMYISYHRIALYSKEEPELRITFDSNILWREEELYLESGVFGTPLLEEGERLMEIKIPGAMPVWLSHILDDLTIYPVSFSKYGKGYQQSLISKRDKTYIRTQKGEVRYA